MLDLILLGLIGLMIYICVKSVNHGENHKCIYCIAEKAINKIKSFIK
jgi:hypothetical protein